MKDGKLSETLNKIAGSDKWRRIILIAGVSGIALLLLSGLDISSCSSKSGTEFSVKAYSEQLEDNLEAAIERMEGAGKTRGVRLSARQRHQNQGGRAVDTRRTGAVRGR